MSAQSFRSIIGIPPSTASINDSTLIIIDAQNEYITGKLATVNVSQTRKKISSLLDLYRSPENNHNAKNIVHIVHKVPDGAPVFTPGTELAEEFTELTPKEGEKVISKQHPSAFAQTELAGYLAGLDGGVGKKIVLTGYMAHICVSTTARAGSELGYDVLVAEDGVGDRDIPGMKGEEVKAAVMAELNDGFATIVKVEDIKK